MPQGRINRKTFSSRIGNSNFKIMISKKVTNIIKQLVVIKKAKLEMVLTYKELTSNNQDLNLLKCQYDLKRKNEL